MFILLLYVGGGGNTSAPISDYTIIGGTVVLQSNGGDDPTITADGAFTFNTAIVEAVLIQQRFQQRPLRTLYCKTALLQKTAGL